MGAVDLAGALADPRPVGRTEPAYMSITGTKQGLITAGAFTEDSVGNTYQEGHEDQVMVQGFNHEVIIPREQTEAALQAKAKEVSAAVAEAQRAATNDLQKTADVVPGQIIQAANTLAMPAPALLNERGLLFSGADMTLRAGDITNLYGDVYSLGRLDIARDDAGNRAASLVRSAAAGPAEPSWRAVGFRAIAGTGRGRESLGPA